MVVYQCFLSVIFFLFVILKFVSGIYTLDVYSHTAWYSISVTLFSLNINSIVSCLLPDIKYSIYVDDLAIYYSSSHMPSIERK